MTITRRSCIIFIGSLSIFIILTFIACNSPATTDNEWMVPADAHKLNNPLFNNELAFEKGKQLYQLYCRSCHGVTGFGDGPARGPLGLQPANFHKEKVKNQTNGDLFWKITTGRKDMPSFEKSLSEEQRWQLVAYIRNIPDKVESRTPVALTPDVKVEHFMQIHPQAVRILQNPRTSDLWYTTFNGDVYRIEKTNNEQPVSEKVFSVADHGIIILQGAVFINNTLFLCGNVYTDDKKSTWGRMVRFELDSLKGKQMSVVFNTVKYAANKTIYDHGWNAMVVSPDEKYIYVNSGARTDHGEIQDNGGEYPKARDNALTAKIFRFPSDAKDLLLPDDEVKLKADGYLFASGIRNAFDISFDPDSNLFAVSNSADYDYPEDMFWIRKDHHYGFPWVMGGLENPQQYKDWQPDPDIDRFINPSSHSWKTKYYYSDPEFPQRPANVKFSPGVQNLGPDANEYRGHSGKILDGDETGVTVSTFTPHACPVGLFFDSKKILNDHYKGDGFVIRYSAGERSSLMRPFTNQGGDLLHLELEYVKAWDNYVVHASRIVEGFNEPTDALMIGNDVYIIEYGGKEGNIWKVTLPVQPASAPKTKTASRYIKN
jgi:glucose/arabinose dehydrogenase